MTQGCRDEIFMHIGNRSHDDGTALLCAFVCWMLVVMDVGGCRNVVNSNMLFIVYFTYVVKKCVSSCSFIVN